MPVAWSPFPWCGLHVRGVIFRARGVVSVPMAWSPCLWCDFPCPWRGPVPVCSTCCITLGLLASYPPMGVFTPENRPAERIRPRGSWHRYQLYDLMPHSKFPEVTSWARGVHVLDSLIHAPNCPQSPALPSFPLSISGLCAHRVSVGLTHGAQRGDSC